MVALRYFRSRLENVQWKGGGLKTKKGRSSVSKLIVFFSCEPRLLVTCKNTVRPWDSVEWDSQEFVWMCLQCISFVVPVVPCACIGVFYLSISVGANHQVSWERGGGMRVEGVLRCV